MSRNTNRKLLDEFWQLFVQEGLHAKGLTQDDIQDPQVPYPTISGLRYDEASERLKAYLSRTGWKRLNNRFRQFKSRKVSNRTTISLRDETLARLRALGQEIGVDDYDMLFEYLLDPEERLEPAKDAVSQMQDALSVGEATHLMLTKLELRASTRRKILAAIKQAYTEGWKKSKTHKGRSNDHLVSDEADAYVNDLSRQY